jgi:hypothetical protein
MTTTMAELLAIASGARVQRTPGDELVALDRERGEAERLGDAERVADADRRIDELFAQARSRLDAEAKRTRAAFSSAVRTPVAPQRSASQRMNEALLRVSGRMW